MPTTFVCFKVHIVFHQDLPLNEWVTFISIRVTLIREVTSSSLDLWHPRIYFVVMATSMYHDMYLCAVSIAAEDSFSNLRLKRTTTRGIS